MTYTLTDADGNTMTFPDYKEKTILETITEAEHEKDAEVTYLLQWHDRLTSFNYATSKHTGKPPYLKRSKAKAEGILAITSSGQRPWLLTYTIHIYEPNQVRRKQIEHLPHGYITALYNPS